MKLRWRLLAALLLAGLLPLIPMVLVVRTTVNMSADALAPASTGQALNASLKLARDHLDALRRSHELKLRAISMEFPLPAGKEEVTAFPTRLMPGQLEELYINLDGYWWAFYENAWTPTSEPDLESGDSIPFGEPPAHLLANRYNRNADWYLIRTLPPEFRESAGRIQAASADWSLRNMQRERLMSSLVGTYVLSYLLAVLFALAAGYFVITPVTRQIESLTGVAQDVRDGNENRRANELGTGEIARLANTFNVMLDRLSASRRRAAEMEKMAAWRSLARVLAHEIKNPLTPIQLSVQQLSGSYNGPDDHFKAMLATTREIVDEEVEGLRKLVREFGDFARAPSLERAHEDPRQILQDLAALYGDKLQISKAGELPESVYLDREKIKRALINLLDNAFSAAPDGHVELTMSSNEGQLIIEVEDSGPGIDPEQREKVWEPYHTTKRTGVGLGLPIVKTTSEQHGGSVHLDSSPRLGGARFQVLIPLS